MLVAQGNRIDALKFIREALVIRERLAKADPANVDYQIDMLRVHKQLAENNDDHVRRWSL